MNDHINFGVAFFVCYALTVNFYGWLSRLHYLSHFIFIEKQRFFLSFEIVTLMAFHRSISRAFWKYKMNLKIFLIVSSVLLGVYTVSARPSQRAVELLNRLKLLSDEVKLKTLL